MTNEQQETRTVNKKELAKIIGNNIKDYRSQSNLTLRELARRTGYTAGYISLLEKGKATPNSYVLAQLADTMGIPISYIFGEEKAVKKDQFADAVLSNPQNKEYIEVLKYIIAKGISPKEIKDTIKFLENIKQDAG